jgi:transglutaminase-like putative cysteine protease
VRYAISHRTTYGYHNSVSVSHHLLRLQPRSLPQQRTLTYELSSDPAPAVVETHPDYFGNLVSFVTIEGPHRQLAVTSHCEVEIVPKSVPDPSITPAWENVRDRCRDDYANCGEACEYYYPSALVPLRPEFKDYAVSSFPHDRPILEAGMDLMARIHADFQFDSQATTVATPVEHVFRQRRGVCQDFAHFQIACFRAVGLSARYVSGYLETVPPPGQTKLVGADASHAWVQLWCGAEGWVDLDPTNSLLPNERHITLAWGRDFADVSPLRGVLVGSGKHDLNVAVDVNQIPESLPS